MIRLIGLLLLLFSVQCVKSSERTITLTPAQAKMVVMNVPEVLRAKEKHRCPVAELLEAKGSTAFFQVRSTCVRQGSGLIGNYTVDLQTGEISADVDKNKDTLIDSTRLRRLRQKLFKGTKPASK